MTVVRGCVFPDNLHYDVPNHTWYAPAENGLVRVGMTVVAVALAREVLVFTPKRAGTTFEKGRSFATIESAKWVGAVRAAFDGVVMEVNQRLIAMPMIANTDPYGEGWMMLMRFAADDWSADLVTNSAIASAYEAWMESEGFAGCEQM